MTGFIFGAFALVFVVLAYIGVPLWLWTLYAAAALFSSGVQTPGWIVFGAIAVVFNTPIRKMISSVVMNLILFFKKI